MVLLSKSTELVGYNTLNQYYYYYYYYNNNITLTSKIIDA